MSVASSASVATLSVAGIVLCTVAADVYRRWRSLDGGLIAAFLAVLGVAAAGTGIALAVLPSGTPVPGRSHRFWIRTLAWPAGAAAFPWGVFVLRYTGRGEIVLEERWRTAVAGVVVATAFAWPALDPLLSAAGVGPGPDAAVRPILAVLGATLPLGWLLFVGGTAVTLARTTHRYEYLGGVHRMSIGMAPFVPVAAVSLGTQFPSVAVPATVVFALGCLLTCGLVATSVYRVGILETSPAAGNIGREALVSELDDPVVVLDTDGRVVDANPAARATFGFGAEDIPEASVSTVLGLPLSAVRDRDVIELETVDGRRRYDAAVSALSGAGGGMAGHAVTLRDVTRRAIRDQRLAVLNRVLRHNLRNELTVARGVATTAAEGEAVPTGMAESLRESADDLVDLGEKAREIERRMTAARIREDPVALGPVIEAVAEEFRERFPHATVETEVPEGLTVRGDPDLIEYVLSNLVENGIVHDDGETPWVAVTATREAGATLPVVVEVTDDGPGIPDHERSVIESGTETDLEHGSGLGLWVAKWGVMRLGGEIRFRDTDRGSTVEVRLASP